MRSHLLILLITLYCSGVIAQGKFFGGIRGGGGSGYQTFSTLPVELLSFEGLVKNDQIVIQWQTATEINNDYFLLEIMGKDGQFEVLEKVIGQGTTKKVSNYQWVDFNPSNGTHYYRLTQFDFDGQYEVLGIIDVSYSENKTLNVFPNPAKDFISVTMPANEGYHFLVYDGNGKKVDCKLVRNKLNVSNWPKGVFYLRYVDTNNSMTTRVQIK